MEKEVIAFNRLKCCLRGSLIDDSVSHPPQMQYVHEQSRLIRWNREEA